MTGREAPPPPPRPLFTRQTVELEIHSAYRPAWMAAEDPVELPVASLLPCNRDGEVLLSFVWNGTARPAIVRDGVGTHVFFPVPETVRNVLLEGYTRFKRPWLSRLPFHYHRFPASVRGLGGSLLTRGANKPAPARFPAFPLEKGLHALLHVLEACGWGWEGMTGGRPGWPENKRYGVVLTHDVDTEAGCRFAPTVLAVERALGFRSSWNVVGRLFEKNERYVDALHAEGCEIGLHGFDHRLRTPFQSLEEISRKLGQMESVLRRYSVRGYRSPCFVRSQILFSALQGAFRYDSSVPDVDVFTPGRSRGGCCLVRPYRIGELVELPVTLPFEIPLHMGFGAGDLNDYWEAKIRWIREAGGMILVNTHPEPQYLGNSAVLRAYETLLRRLAGNPDAWYALPREVTDLNRKTESRRRERVATPKAPFGGSQPDAPSDA